MSTAKLTRKGTAHLPAEVRRAQILEAAMRSFGERGFAATTMDDLAAACALSKGSLYRYFDSKEDVLWALFESFSEVMTSIFDVRSESPDALDKLGRAGTAILESVAAEGQSIDAWLEFFSYREFRPRFAEMYEQSRQQLAQVIRSGIVSGEIRPLDPVDAAAALVALMEGLMLQAMVDAEFDVHHHWRGAWQTFREGLEADPPAVQGR